MDFKFGFGICRSQKRGSAKLSLRHYAHNSLQFTEQNFFARVDFKDVKYFVINLQSGRNARRPNAEFRFLASTLPDTQFRLQSPSIDIFRSPIFPEYAGSPLLSRELK